MDEKHPWFNAEHTPLPNEAEQIFEQFAKIQNYAKGTPIYNQGERADFFYYLKKGKVKIVFNSYEGFEKTVSVAGAGSIMGEAAFFDQMPRVSSAKTVTACEIISINHHTLLKIFGEYPSLAVYLLNLQAQSIRMLSTHISSITFQSAEWRIANVLLQSMAVQDELFVVRLTHEDIGNMVGVSRVTVSKLLNTFAKKGWIKTAYRSIVVLKPEKLRSVTESV